MDLSTYTVDFECAKIAMTIEGVDGGAVIIGEKARPCEVVRARGEVDGQRPIHETERHRLGGLGSLGHE